jgi:hypothetical protein
MAEEIKDKYLNDIYNILWELDDKQFNWLIGRGYKRPKDIELIMEFLARWRVSDLKGFLVIAKHAKKLDKVM